MHILVAIAFFPVVESPWASPRKAALKQYKEDVFHQCIFHLFSVDFLEAQYDGIYVSTWAGKVYHGIPIVSLWVGDHPEQSILSLIHEGQCPVCGDVIGDFNNLNTSFKQRDVKKMQEAFVQAKEYFDEEEFGQMIRLLKSAGHACNSIVSYPYCPTLNSLWMLRWFSYSCLTPEEMHDFSGLFLYLLTQWKKCVVFGYGVAGSKEGPGHFVDQSYMNMPLFNGLPRFTKGILHLKTFTAARHRVLMKTMVCVMADVFPTDKDWVHLYVCFLEFYALAKQDMHSSDDVKAMKVLLKKFDEAAHQTLLVWSPTNLNFIKFHVLKHIYFFIVWCGNMRNYSANVLEALHKIHCKVS